MRIELTSEQFAALHAAITECPSNDLELVGPNGIMVRVPYGVVGEILVAECVGDHDLDLSDYQGQGVHLWSAEKCMRFLESRLGLDLNTIDWIADGDVAGWQGEVIRRIAEELGNMVEVRCRRCNELLILDLEAGVIMTSIETGDEP